MFSAFDILILVSLLVTFLAWKMNSGLTALVALLFSGAFTLTTNFPDPTQQFLTIAGGSFLAIFDMILMIKLMVKGKF